MCVKLCNFRRILLSFFYCLFDSVEFVRSCRITRFYKGLKLFGGAERLLVKIYEFGVVECCLFDAAELDFFVISFFDPKYYM